MCGIAGIYHLNNQKLSIEKLKRFTDSMSHRGPDGAGYELFDNELLGFGHRRLSILDLSEAGKQPMSYADERYWICYNGEVFNFQKIKNELLAKNYTFKSDTDTEVILAAYIEWGKDCLHKFNGMWAFAIWDKQEQTMFLSRDRFGIKPLYYYFEAGKFFAFASETRNFKFLDNFQRNINQELLDYNLKDNYALEGIGYTIFDNIYQLLPGHYIEFEKSDNHIQQKRWFDILDFNQQQVPEKLEEQAEKFYEIFRDACKLRLISDVPVATALSGGLDSTAVYSTVFDIIKNESLNRINANSQKAFTAIFPGLENDEEQYAKKAIDFTKGEIEYICTDVANLAATIEKETELVDFISSAPITSISAVYKGMKKAGISVSMDGHGVDEMLYGYRDMIHNLYIDALFTKGKNPQSYADVLLNMYHSDKHNTTKQKFDKEIKEKQLREKSLSFKLKYLIKGEQAPLDKAFIPLPLKSLSDKPYDFSKFSLSKRMVYFEFFQNTLPALLRNFDRAGMINSIEIRMPFMDWRLVTYIFSLPEESKLGKGFTKLIVREAMKNRMDESLRTRTFKVGIGSPIEHWLKTYLKDWVINSITNQKLKEDFLNNNQNYNSQNQIFTKVWQEINIKLIK
jgi:asparagine synthase (glutamine-hydrolysing)